MELTLKQKTAFGIGAVGKDMVYALSASYVMYYYQDVLGLSASFVGLVLMAARFFDAFNDPFMGVLVAKTRTRWGRFRPWIFSGTLLNALVLYALFAAPVLDEAALMVYFSVMYILWGVTYTMMDIPYWSMIPAVTRTPKDRENLSMVGRTCAGVGSALIAMFTMLLVGILGETFIYYNCSSPEEVKQDVPGRHAIAHGWYRTYPTRKTALNAILFTDFLIDLKPILQ